MEFVFAVMGKYLQMVVAYSIFENEPDQVVHHFEQFNSDFYEACAAFKEVTHQMFKAGQKVEMLKPIVPVIPVKRQPTLELGLSNEEAVRVEQFLERHGLQELLQIFLKKGVAVDDILEMTKEEMEELGIKAYGLRKRLLRVIQSQHQEGHNDSAQVQQTQAQQQVYHQVQVWHDHVSSQDNLYRVLLMLLAVLPRTHRGSFM